MNRGCSVRIEVHDVNHGSCVTVTGPSGHVMMLDCGQNLERPWSPAVAFANQTIQTLILQNIDEDHVKGLPRLCQVGPPVRGIYSNPTVTAVALNSMKSGCMGSGVQHTHTILKTYGPGGTGEWQHDLGGVYWQASPATLDLATYTIKHRLTISSARAA